jgi:hypothetical protein
VAITVGAVDLKAERAIENRRLDAHIRAIFNNIKGVVAARRSRMNSTTWVFQSVKIVLPAE